MSSKGVTIETGLQGLLTSQPVPDAGISQERGRCLGFALLEALVGGGGCQRVQAGYLEQVKEEYRI